ncbi:p15 [Cocksfoot mild mosaic virus]|uniref:p15 n=1 Tax=Cocksfoot mild mosaic virus TaxID=479060 RepID=B4XS00_9TOMB|nr:p15 [Cocksfoot mild mosaic virus]ABW74554.1 p15 [Cocksfoot mild mosaic virus]
MEAIPLTEGDVARHYKDGLISLLEVGPSSVLAHWPMAKLWARHPPGQWLIDEAGRSIPSRKSYFASLPRRPITTRLCPSYLRSCSTPAHNLDMGDELSIWPVYLSSTLNMSGGGCSSPGYPAVPRLHREMWF